MYNLMDVIAETVAEAVLKIHQLGFYAQKIFCIAHVMAVFFIQ